jgi:hypothetical protein
MAAIFGRICIGISGLTLALPAGGLFGLSQLLLLAIALVLLALGIGCRHFFVIHKEALA